MLTTTLKKIKKHNPCGIKKEDDYGYKKLLTYLGKTKADDKPLPYAIILKSNGIDDALWCCRCEPQYEKHWRTFALWCARQVQHLMIDQRSIDCLDTYERYVRGKATIQQVAAARDAAKEKQTEKFLEIVS